MQIQCEQRPVPIASQGWQRRSKAPICNWEHFQRWKACPGWWYSPWKRCWPIACSLVKDQLLYNGQITVLNQMCICYQSKCRQKWITRSILWWFIRASIADEILARVVVRLVMVFWEFTRTPYNDKTWLLSINTFSKSQIIWRNCVLQGCSYWPIGMGAIRLAGSHAL